MKICIGYYDKDGNHIGKTLDKPDREKYFVAMGTLSKKIREHETQNPYSKSRLNKWSVESCDETRLKIHIDVYINGTLNQRYASIPWSMKTNTETKPLYKTLERICQDIEASREKTAHKYKIQDKRHIYLPMYV